MQNRRKTRPAARGILRDVDFALSAGETAAIVVALPARARARCSPFWRAWTFPAAVRCAIADADIFQLDEDARAAVRARSVGFVFQSLQLLGNLTAIENVMLPLELAGRPSARADAARMLERVGLGSRLKSYPKVLSGGEQQRVALARAFVVQPVLLLADESYRQPGLRHWAKTIMALMLELNQEQGTTLVWVTHDRRHCRPLFAGVHHGGRAFARGCAARAGGNGCRGGGRIMAHV
jgi:putative ABC transport system ATP-binding protein